MPKTCKLILILVGLISQGFGQAFDKKIETEKLLDLILKQDTISKNIFDFADNINDYEFEGDYSIDKLFPNRIKGDSTENYITISVICVAPLEFEMPIYKVLKTIDASYDSTYYQEQIKNVKYGKWSLRKFNNLTKVKFVKWEKLHHETNHISFPIFSKDKNIAMIKFGSTNGKGMSEKQTRILIFKKLDNDWQLVQTINSIKN